jgi:enamine deaminase RidA (YjgF/YER057c/UK114 family)
MSAEAVDWKSIIGFRSVVRRGPLVVVAGTAPLGPDGRVVHHGDPYAQTMRCLERIDGLLGEVGARLQDVVKTRLFIAREGSSWEAVGRAHGEVFGEILPVTTMTYADLIDPDFTVEIDVMAWVGETA